VTIAVGLPAIVSLSFKLRTHLLAVRIPIENRPTQIITTEGREMDNWTIVSPIL
jgi:hypothetical protein